MSAEPADNNYYRWPHGQPCSVSGRNGRYVGYTTTGNPIVEFMERRPSVMKGLPDVPVTVLRHATPLTISKGEA